MKKIVIPILFALILGSSIFYYRRLPQNVSLNPELQRILKTPQLSNPESLEFVKSYGSSCDQNKYDQKISEAIQKMTELNIFALEITRQTEKRALCFQDLFRSEFQVLFLKENHDPRITKNYVGFLSRMALGAATSADRMLAVEALALAKIAFKSQWSQLISEDYNKVLQLRSPMIFSQTMENELRITDTFIKDTKDVTVALYTNSMTTIENLPVQGEIGKSFNAVRTQNIIFSQWRTLIEISEKCLSTGPKPSGCVVESIMGAEKSASTNPDYTPLDKKISRKFMAFQVFKKAQKFDSDIKNLSIETIK